MNKVLRTILMILGILVLAAFLFGFGYQVYGIVSGAHWGGMYPIMMGGWGMHRGGLYGGFPFLGGILGLGVLALVVGGLVALLGRRTPNLPARVCAHCGQALEPGWIACPHCGEKV